MMGVFSQVNVNSRRAISQPVGYVLEENGCWSWVGPMGSNGYGLFKVNKRMQCAHRVVYEMHRGEIADGLQLDHLCRNRKCVNPDHLEPVTCRENLLRGHGLTAINAKKTHCPNGHALEGSNILWDDGSRKCRTCNNERQRKARRWVAYRERQRAKREGPSDE